MRQGGIQGMGNQWYRMGCVRHGVHQYRCRLGLLGYCTPCYRYCYNPRGAAIRVSLISTTPLTKYTGFGFCRCLPYP